MIDILYIWTSDSLRLQGIHYGSEKKDSCVLLIHGMSGNFIENYFAHVLGQKLAKNYIGFIYSHNRGYNHINDIVTKKGNLKLKRGIGYKTKRIGAIYERFLESEIDIEGWIGKCRELGYKKIILLGHSLGCNKAVHYYYKNHPKDVTGIILASPPDMVGLAKLTKYQPSYEKLLKEARKNVADGKPRKLLSDQLWNWYQLSSQTFLDLCEEGGPADNLPVLRNPKKFPELESVSVPILGIMGEKDDIEIRSLEEDLDLIQSKATNCPEFTKEFIKEGTHTYDRQEDSFARVVLVWINETALFKN